MPPAPNLQEQEKKKCIEEMKHKEAHSYICLQ